MRTRRRYNYRRSTQYFAASEVEAKANFLPPDMCIIDTKTTIEHQVVRIVQELHIIIVIHRNNIFMLAPPDCDTNAATLREEDGLGSRSS